MQVFYLTAAEEHRATKERVLGSYTDSCPGARSIKESIEISSSISPPRKIRAKKSLKWVMRRALAAGNILAEASAPRRRAGVVDKAPAGG
jgi:hypothetical protein